MYRECVDFARAKLKAYGDSPLGCLPYSNQLTQVHYTFYFAQQLTLPHHSRQEGPLYFTSPRKVQLFGVCMEGVAEQHNYLIDKNCTIGVNGSHSHGPNTMISMLHHAFQEYGLGEMACHIHCDNCSGWFIYIYIYILLYYTITYHGLCHSDFYFLYITVPNQLLI